MPTTQQRITELIGQDWSETNDDNEQEMVLTNDDLDLDDLDEQVEVWGMDDLDERYSLSTSATADAYYRRYQRYLFYDIFKDQLVICAAKDLCVIAERCLHSHSHLFEHAHREGMSCCEAYCYFEGRTSDEYWQTGYKDYYSICILYDDYEHVKDIFTLENMYQMHFINKALKKYHLWLNTVRRGNLPS
jgi:hypothetical protein